MEDFMLKRGDFIFEKGKFLSKGIEFEVYIWDNLGWRAA